MDAFLTSTSMGRSPDSWLPPPNAAAPFPTGGRGQRHGTPLPLRTAVSLRRDAQRCWGLAQTPHLLVKSDELGVLTTLVGHPLCLCSGLQTLNVCAGVVWQLAYAWRWRCYCTSPSAPLCCFSSSPCGRWFDCASLRSLSPHCTAGAAPAAGLRWLTVQGPSGPE